MLMICFALCHHQKGVSWNRKWKDLYINFPFFSAAVLQYCWWLFSFSFIFLLNIAVCSFILYMYRRSKTQNTSSKYVYLKILKHNGPLPGYYWVIIINIYFFLALANRMIRGNGKWHRQNLTLLSFFSLFFCCFRYQVE